MFNEFLERVVYPLLDDLDTAVALKMKILMRNGEWDSAIAVRVDPSHYDCPDRFFRDNQAVELLRKCSNLPSKVDKRAAAVELFHSAEKQCSRTNIRLQDLISNTNLVGYDERVYSYVKRVKSLVKDVLGALPKDLDAARFGPGATFHDRGVFITTLDKMSNRPTLTTDASWVTDLWDKTLWFRALASELSLIHI